MNRKVNIHVLEIFIVITYRGRGGSPSNSLIQSLPSPLLRCYMYIMYILFLSVAKDLHKRVQIRFASFWAQIVIITRSDKIHKVHLVTFNHFNTHNMNTQSTFFLCLFKVAYKE